MPVMIYSPEGVGGGGPASNVAVTNFPVSQTINGTVGVSGEVEVVNDSGNPLPVTGTVAISNSEVEISNGIGNPVPVSGTVSVSSDSLNPVTIAGDVTIVNPEIEIKNDVGNPVPVSGTVAISNAELEISNDSGNPVPVSGTVAVSNTEFEIVNDTGNPIPVSGTVAVSNTEFEIVNDTGNPIPVSGTVAISNGSLEVSNDAGNPLPVSGQVTVATGPLDPIYVIADPTFPVPVTGTVAISNPELEITNAIGNPIPVVSTQNNPVIVNQGPASAAGFGENLTAELTPVVQLEAIYGLGNEMEDEFERFSQLGGATGTNESLFQVSCSATNFSYGVLRSSRFLRYRPGQSATGRFTAAFGAPAANVSQRAGLFNQEAAWMVGYNGTDFGVLHSYGAKAAIVRIVVVSGPSSNTDLTITFAGFPLTPIPLVAGEDRVETAARIANSGVFGAAWNVEQVGSTVFLVSTNTNPLSNTTFTYSHSDSVGLAILDRDGVSPTDAWTPAASFNVDKLDGSGPSGMIIDPTKLNVFQIRYKWLGAGAISFMIEDSLTGNNIEFHRILWSNQNNVPHVANPSMKIGYVCYNLGGGVQTEVTGSSMMLAVDGKRELTHFPKAVAVSKTGLSNDNVDPDDIHHIVSIRNPLTISGKINTRELILQNASLTAVSSDPTNFLIYLDADLISGYHIWQTLAKSNATYSNVDGEIDGTAFTPLAISTVVGGGVSGGGKDISLLDYDIVVPAGSTISICARSSTNITELSTAITWTVD